MLAHAEGTGADLVYPWFDVIGGTDPFPQNRGRQYVPQSPAPDSELFCVPITYLVRADLLAAGMDATGGFQVDHKDWGSWNLQDLPLFDWMARHCRTFASPEVTWTWRHHGVGAPGRPGNTSGLGSRWGTA